MINALYLAMWVTNFITIVNKELHNTWFWHVLMFGPLFVVVPCIGQIVKTASILSATAELDLDVIGAMCCEYIALDSSFVVCYMCYVG